MQLNLGCGNNHFPGWINVDKFAECNPDQIVDLECFPWPWQDNSVDEVRMFHILEHLGQTSDIFLSIMKELYRVCKPEALIKIAVPHPRHDHYLGDPTHVRPITPQLLDLFSKAKCKEWKEMGAANSPLATYLDVDFVVEDIQLDLDEPWLTRYLSGELSQDDANFAVRSYNNVVSQFKMDLRVVKAAPYK